MSDYKMLKAEEAVADIGGGRIVRLETGRIAKQAAGAAMVHFGDAVVLATVCYGAEALGDFFPLTVEYKEKAYAAGKFPGGYIKRENRPSDEEILTARIIDRPIRPMFPEGFRREVQLFATVLSADKNYDSSALSVCAASLAIGLSSLPFEEQVAAVRVAVVDGSNIVNPTYDQLAIAELDLMVAGTQNSVTMVEGGSYEVSEEVVISAIMAGHEAIKLLCQAQQELVNRVGKASFTVEKAQADNDLVGKVHEIIKQKLIDSLHIPMVKTEHYPAMAALQQELLLALGEQYADRAEEVKGIFHDLERDEMRRMILDEGRRIDGRSTTDIRPIEIQTSILPSVHGSALFQRGETQALVTCTLGTKADEQRVESLQGEVFKNYMLHYNFPPYSVGEVKRAGSVSRREVGHGHLAERSLLPVLPHPEDFPYTIRIVSEIMESNGSSSMASVCGGSLALMDSGVPIKESVAGIAMGLISDGDKVAILSDITGTEDHLGDMDFKVTGTRTGITAFQMDIKIKGITPELMGRALEQAKNGRLHILEKMAEKGLAAPRPRLSDRAPVVVKMRINTSKIRDVIGPGGAIIKGIQANTGSNVNINDDGRIEISAPNGRVGEIARRMIEEIVAEAEVGRVYKGKVKSVVEFGAFIEILPGRDGLVHVSELANYRVDKVEDVVKVGDELTVKCIGVDPRGKIKLSVKALTAE